MKIQCKEGAKGRKQHLKSIKNGIQEQQTQFSKRELSMILGLRKVGRAMTYQKYM